MKNKTAIILAVIFGVIAIASALWFITDFNYESFITMMANVAAIVLILRDWQNK